MINSFKGKYRFLSNFYPSPFRDENGNVWPTVEHYYQAAKSNNYFFHQYVRSLPSPAAAKKAGQRLTTIRADWEQVKTKVMEKALTFKFTQNPNLKAQLIKTRGEFLVEGNYWHDNIWGDCYCPKCKNIEGQNHLGKLLMKIRKTL